MAITNEYLHQLNLRNKELWKQPHVPILYLNAAQKMFGVELSVFYCEGFMRVVPRGVEVPVYGPGAQYEKPRRKPQDDDYMLVTHDEAAAVA